MVAFTPYKIRTLAELRKEKGMTQQELAHKLGIHRTTLNRHENEHVKPDRGLLCLAAMIMGFQPCEIKGYMERDEVKG